MPIRYIPYIPEPLRGQALLGNFNRLLRYRGNDEILRNGLPLYETAVAERVGESEAATQNLLLHGDCRAACALLRDRGIQVDLVYIDPPFASGADYAKRVVLRPNPLTAKTAAGAPDGEELEDAQGAAFEEKMYGDIWEKERYLNWMYDNLMAIKTVMSDNASIYVHLDWHIGHYVKILLDEIFGEDNFRNEIVWCYTGPSPVKGYFPRKHDTIFWYVKDGADYVFNEAAIRQPYKAQFTQARGIYGVNDKSEDEQRALFERGKVPEDWWADMSNISAYRDELVGYATQKPEALLERIIKASSDAGMVVADFFGGSGVAAAVAARLGRRFVTCDVNRNAIQTMRDRLVAQGTAFTHETLLDGVNLYRNPVQTMDRLCSLVPNLHRLTSAERDQGLTDFWFGAFQSPADGVVPVWMPDLKDASGRVLCEATLRNALYSILPALNDRVKKAVFYYVDTEQPLEAFKQLIKCENQQTVVQVVLRDLKPVLEQAVLSDQAEWRLVADRDGLLRGWRLRLTAFYSDRLAQIVAEVNGKAAVQPSCKGRRVIALSPEGLEAVEWVGVDCEAERGPWHSSAEVRIEPNGWVTKDGHKTKERWDGTLFCEGEKPPLRLKIRSILGDETTFLLT